jgi:hypothetical protein
MTSEVVFALYRPHPGKDAELKALIHRHGPALKKSGLTTERPTLLLKAGDGTYLEIFEWVSSEASRFAHRDPEVGPIWMAMEAVADFVSLDSLAEAKRPFTHFTPVT